MVEFGTRSQLVYPVSATQIRELMLGIPSWARIVPVISDGTSFEDSGMDSLAFIEFVEELQNVSGLNIPDEDAEHLATIAGAVGYLNGRLR